MSHAVSAIMVMKGQKKVSGVLFLHQNSKLKEVLVPGKSQKYATIKNLKYPAIIFHIIFSFNLLLWPKYKTNESWRKMVD